MTFGKFFFKIYKKKLFKLGSVESFSSIQNKTDKKKIIVIPAAASKTYLI